MIRVLITGGSSLLGRYLKRSKPDNIDITHTWYTNYVPDALQMDLTNKSQIAYVFRRAKPNVVIHCAAIGDVAFAQENYAETYAVNVKGTENIIDVAENYKSKIIYMSSNAVYAGDNPPYRENSKLKPINIYGSIKVQAEEKIKNYRDWVIVRPFMLYGWPYRGGRNNWASSVHRKLRIKEKMKIVNDVFYQPTYALHCAEAVWQLFNIKNEIVNIASNDRLSLYDFCRNVALIFGHDERLIQPIETSQLNLKAKRPVDTTFDLSKLSSFGIKIPKLKAGLLAMSNEI